MDNIWSDISMRYWFYVEREYVFGKSDEKHEKWFAVVLLFFSFLIKFLFSIKIKKHTEVE